MIILTATQADRARGHSPLIPGHALDPIPIRAGRFMLPEGVLLDPAHADVRDFLDALPKRAVDPAEVYVSSGPLADPARVAQAEADAAEIRSRNIPDYKERVRPPPDEETVRTR